MEIRKVIRRKIRHRNRGVDVAADINVVAAANLGRPRPDSTGPASDLDRSSMRGGEDDDEAGVPRDES
jgi:hypothetical protein